LKSYKPQLKLHELAAGKNKDGIAAGKNKANESASSKNKDGMYPGVFGEPLVNPWAKSRDFRVLDDIQPTAPFDRVDRQGMSSIMGDAPLGPGEKGYDHPEGMAVYKSVRPDIVPPYQHPDNFPYEDATSRCADTRDVEIGDRVIVGKADRIRPHGRWEWSPSVNYPLVSPMDRIKPGPQPVASEDRVPDKYSKYFEQLYDDEGRRKKAQYLVEAFKVADTANDGDISRDEFDGVVMGNQQKTQEEADRLWERYSRHPSVMSRDDYLIMAADGFDLGYVNRSDVGNVLQIQCPSSFGFWGGGVACQNGSYVVGASIQVKPIAASNDTSADNTAMNNIKMLCDDGNELSSMGNDEGEWSPVGQCPEGQKMDGFSARNKPYSPGRDNTGLNDIKFKCRSTDLQNISTVRFGNKTAPENKGESPNAIWAPIVVANEGGWGPNFNCGSSGMICGFQTRVQLPTPTMEGMGITDVRFFCCSAPINCTAPCGADNFSQACQSCEQMQEGAKPQSR
jgi:hypothetical protein